MILNWYCETFNTQYLTYYLHRDVIMKVKSGADYRAQWESKLADKSGQYIPII